MKTICIFLSVFLFITCKTKSEKAIEGLWSIDTIYYKNNDLQFCLHGNIINFKLDDFSDFPIAEKDCGAIITSSQEGLAKVKIKESETTNDSIPLRMDIKTNNEIFSGIHKIVFHKDEENKLLKMEIWSDSLYIICHKGLFNFNDNIDLINDLEKISWTTRPRN